MTIGSTAADSVAQARDTDFTADRCLSAEGLLATFNAAGVLTSGDVQTARTLQRIAASVPGLDEPIPAVAGPPESATPAPKPADEWVGLAVALCVRALRHGSTAISLREAATVFDTTEDGDPAPALPWPDPGRWLAACAAHPLISRDPTASVPLVLVDDRLYLQRYWVTETEILNQILLRMAGDGDPAPGSETEALRDALEALFPKPVPDLQRLATAAALTGRLTILAGGPGTGKTTTITAIVLALRAADPTVSVALAAPTGKAAARMAQAITEARDRHFNGFAVPDDLPAMTLHRLLGRRPDLDRPFLHDRHNPLPHDVVIVDECSMVDVTMMRRLMEAVRPEARLILVGDPNQLASVDAGAVLADLVAVSAPTPDDRRRALRAIAPVDDPADVTGCGTVTLLRGHRFTSAIADLATAIAEGDADRTVALLRGGGPDIVFVDHHARPDDPALAELRNEVTATATEVQTYAAAGEATKALLALDTHRLLCAHRTGPAGVSTWNAAAHHWIRQRGTSPLGAGAWQVGQGVMITANDYALGLRNGDAGVIVAQPDGEPVAAFTGSDDTLLIPPVRLDAVMPLDAMTIHRGQGSQFESVTVILPEPGSPLLTRELLYTAVTRAKRRVRVIGSAESVTAAVQRRVVRASGLRDRLDRALTGP